MPLLRLRLEQRQANGTDPSEAAVAVLELLSQSDESLDECERSIAIVVDAARAQSPATIAWCWLAAV